MAKYIYSMEDGSTINISNHASFDSMPSWSPDGRWIAFQSERDNFQRDLYIMDPNGDNVTQLTDDAAWDSSPAWSPDGKRIAFQSNWDGDFDIFIIDIESRALTRVTDNPADDGFPVWVIVNPLAGLPLAVSPAGLRLSSWGELRNAR